MTEANVTACFEAWKKLDETERTMLEYLQRGFIQGRGEAALPSVKRGRPAGSRNRRKVASAPAAQEAVA